MYIFYICGPILYLWIFPGRGHSDGRKPKALERDGCQRQLRVTILSCLKDGPKNRV